jgi:hypothetical protein
VTGQFLMLVSQEKLIGLETFIASSADKFVLVMFNKMCAEDMFPGIWC